MVDTKWLRYVTDVCSVDNRGLTVREIDSMFNQQEVQILLGGVNSPVDLEDLRKHTNYGGLWDDKEETIITFWNVSSRTSESLFHRILTSAFNSGCRLLRSRVLLRFVTSCSRPLLLLFTFQTQLVTSECACQWIQGAPLRFAMLARTSNVYQLPARVLIYSRYDFSLPHHQHILIGSLAASKIQE